MQPFEYWDKPTNWCRTLFSRSVLCVCALVKGGFRNQKMVFQDPPVASMTVGGRVSAVVKLEAAHPNQGTPPEAWFPSLNPSESKSRLVVFPKGNWGLFSKMGYWYFLFGVPPLFWVGLKGNKWRTLDKQTHIYIYIYKSFKGARFQLFRDEAPLISGLRVTTPLCTLCFLVGLSLNPWHPQRGGFPFL